MPLVFSPPPRLTHERDELSTGSAPEQRPARHPRSPHAPRLPRTAPRIGAAVGAAVLLLSACTAGPEEHTLATPTAATPTDTAEAVPEYTTDLQLSEEEKKAVDEAIPKLDEYISLLNEVYSSGGGGIEKLDGVARDQVLFAAKDEVKQMKDQDVRMVGEYRLESRRIETVDLRVDDNTQIPFVTIHSCIPLHEYSIVPNESNETPGDAEATDTYQFVIAQYDGEWFVSEHDLWDHGCAS